MELRRRSLLALAATGVGGTLAGCTSSDEPTESEATTESETSEPTESTRPDGQTTATLRTTKGDIVVELYGDRAPRTVENFVGLATGSKTWVDPQTGESVDGEPLYEDVLFHRVIDDFMIQTGDPTGTGRGGPGYQFDDEFHEDLRHDGPGVVSMANAGPDTNGSQFFITLDAQPHLDGRHAVFGQVIEGMAVVEAIGAVETDDADRPVNDVVLESVTIETA
ncbi:peptidylprolyl isomerase [Haloferax profundi]|uniref:peptidylprolyl isomerase n=1 Tax=Haloferax profundi TaxID=1544718 RepID=UPI0009E8F75C